MTVVDYGPDVAALRRRLEAAEAEVARLTAERDEARAALMGARADAFRRAEEAVRSIADFFRMAGQKATADHAVGAIHAAMDHDRWDQADAEVPRG